MIWYQDKNGVEKLWFEVDTPVVALKAFSKSSQTGPYMEEPEVDETNCFFKNFPPPQGPTSVQKTTAAASTCAWLPQAAGRAGVTTTTPW